MIAIPEQQIAMPRDEQEVAEAIRAARADGLRVAAGRDAVPADGVLALRTCALAGVELDVRTHRARVRAGSRWAELSDPAAHAGLAALAGTARSGCVVGDVLAGGLSWLARRHGLAASFVRAIELVTADGELVRTDRDHEPELFWALRGGGGGFGVVTAIELSLVPLDDVYAGALFFPFERAAEVLQAWREWTATVPEEVTSVGRLMRFPDGPGLVAGRSFALIEAACLGTDAADVLRPLRELGPELDTFTTIPPSALRFLHMEPEPPGLVDHRLLDDVPIDDLVALAGSPLTSVDLWHTGGALARPAPHGGALASLPGSYRFRAAGVPSTATEAQLALVGGALAPYDAGPSLDLATETRVQAVREAVDPDGVFTRA